MTRQNGLPRLAPRASFPGLRLGLIVFVLVPSMVAASPTLEGVTPGVGQRGTEFTLTLTGARLGGPLELMFYSPGLVCTRLVATSASEVKATLQTAPDCRLGEHPFRLRTKTGISPLRIVRITPFRVVPETEEDNDTRESAQVVPLNVSVAGTLEADGVDCYKVALKKGDRLAAEVEGVRLGGEGIDATLTVYGPDGKELVTVDDTPLFRQDPFVTLIAPTDGTYSVAVSDGGGSGEDAGYVLHVGTFVRPAAIFPVGGPAGEQVRVKLLGDAGGSRTQDVKLPARPDPHHVLYPTDGKTTAPTPHPFRVSPFPNVMEAEPNDDLRQATPSPGGWPVAFNGILDKVGDRDHYRFQALKGDALDVQVFAVRLGAPLDSVLTVLGPTGERIATNDDDETHDSRVLFTAPADGAYTLQITDKRLQGGPLYVYRIEVDRQRPGLALFLPGPVRKSQTQQAIVIPRGNRVTAFLAVRRSGVAGEVQINAGELPRGVRLHVGPIPAGEYLVPVVFEAEAEAPIGGRLVSLTGRCENGKTPVTGGFVQVVDLIRGPGDSSLHTITVSQLAVAVVEPAPFALTLTPPVTPLVADGSLDVKVQVERNKGFTSAVEVTLQPLPHGVEGPTSVLIPADRSEAVFPLTGQRDIPPSEWKLIAEGKPSSGQARDPNAAFLMMMAGMGGGRRRAPAEVEATAVASQPVTLRLGASPVKGEISAVSAEQGKAVRVVCKLDLGPPLEGAFQATLEGLPPRAAVTPVYPARGARELEFEVNVAATTPVGTHDSLVCVLQGQVGGQKVAYRVGRGGILKVDPPGAAKAATKDGKPLSPLEALRQREKTSKPSKP